MDCGGRITTKTRLGQGVAYQAFFPFRVPNVIIRPSACGTHLASRISFLAPTNSVSAQLLCSVLEISSPDKPSGVETDSGTHLVRRRGLQFRTMQSALPQPSHFNCRSDRR